MQRTPPGPAVRFSLAAVFTSVAAIGCSSLLGIDGTYVTDENAPSIGHDGDAQAGGATGIDETGGSSGVGGSESGGAGGDPAGGAGGAGAAPETGGAGAGGAPQPTDTCKPGLYTGTFDGKHKPAVTGGFSGDLTISRGTLSFSLTGTPPILDIAQGKMSGGFAWGNFDAALTGTYECDTGALVAHVHGNLKVIPLSPVIDGELMGDLLGDPATRTWSEQEAGTNGAVGHGSGTWSASYGGP